MSGAAFIVGLEKYAVAAAPPLFGPANNALRFALWTHAQGVDPASIFLFLTLSKSEATYNPLLQAVNDKGIQPRFTGAKEDIWKAWMDELRLAPKGDLFAFWSGHGFAFQDGQQAVLSSTLAPGDEPDYIFLSELTGSLSTNKFRQFSNQRVVVDACANFIKPEDLGASFPRRAQDYPIEKTPARIALTAVPLGKGAIAEDGSTLFARSVLDALEPANPWPTDSIAFFVDLKKAIAAHNPKATPCLTRIQSPDYSDEASSQFDPGVERRKALLHVLNQCALPDSTFLEFFRQSVASLPRTVERANPASLLSAIEQLLALDTDGNAWSNVLVEFAARIIRGHPAESQPLAAFLAQNATPKQLATVDLRLAQEHADWVLAVLLQESMSTPDKSAAGVSPFPANVSAVLSDTSFTHIVNIWKPVDTSDASALRSAIRDIYVNAQARASKLKKQLEVQIVANPVLFPVPYHTAPIEDDEPAIIIGESVPFILRCRDRNLHRSAYPADPWRQKTQALKALPKVPIHRESAFHEKLGLSLGGYSGLLNIAAPLDGAPGLPTPILRVITLALKKGLPLITWRCCEPDNADWDAFEVELQKLLANPVPQLAAKLSALRASNDWARNTVLLWDDADALPQSLMEEPEQV
jgi:hypothetical protein